MSTEHSERLGEGTARIMDHVRTGAGAKTEARRAIKRALWDGKAARKNRGVTLRVVIDGEALPCDLRTANAVGADRMMAAIGSAVAGNKPAAGLSRSARKRFWRLRRAETLRGILAAGGM